MNPAISRRDVLLELERLATMLAASCADPVWIIGSTATWLSTAQAALPQDIDVLTSERDAATLVATHRDLVDTTYRPVDDGRFRSRFARLRLSPLPVEVMGGLEVRRGEDWIRVLVEDGMRVACGEQAVGIPNLREQVRLFELFGRDKDLARARHLQDMLHAVPH